MSLQINISQLYGNIVSSRLWSALTEQDRRDLINAAGPRLSDAGRSIWQNAQQQGRNLTDAEYTTISTFSTVQVPDDLLIQRYLATRPTGPEQPSAMEQLQKLREQAEKDVDQYLTKDLATFLDKPELNTILVNKKTPLPQFSSAERARRREASAAIRQAQIKLTAWNNEFYPKLKSLSRLYGSLYAPDFAMPAGQNHNKEIEWLFDEHGTNWEAYYNTKAAELKESRDYAGKTGEEIKSQIKENLARRRGDIVMEAMHDAYDVYQNLDTLTDPSLPPDELAVNYLRIQRAVQIVSDAGKYLEDVGRGFLRLSDDGRDRKLLNSLNRASISNALAGAGGKLGMIANPFYEQFDINTVLSNGLSSYYGDGYMWRTNAVRFPDWLQDKIDRQPEFKYYTASKVNDSFTEFLTDGIINAMSIDLSMETMQKDIIKDFGFEQHNATVFRENYEGGVKPLDQPVAYQQGDRVIVIQRKSVADVPSVMHPESLFNYSRRGTGAALSRTLLDTDPWYVLNKRQFRELKSAMRAVNDQPPLKPDFTAEDIEAAKRRYEALYRAGREYLAHRERRLDRTHRQSDRETARSEAAVKLMTHAKDKLKQLELVRKARATLEKYRGMAPDEIREATAAENKTPEMTMMIAAMDAKERMQNPAVWFKRVFSDNANLPSCLDKTLNANLSTLKQKWTEKDWLKAQIRGVSKTDLIEKSVGAVIASELILQERMTLEPGQKIGPLETMFSDNKQIVKRTKELGTVALKLYAAQNQCNPNQLDQLHHNMLVMFLQNFDPRTRIGDYKYVAQRMLDEENMRNQYVESIPFRANLKKGDSDTLRSPFMDYAEKAIVQPLLRCCPPPQDQQNLSPEERNILKGKGTKISPDELEKLLSNAIVYGMIKNERADAQKHGVGPLEDLLREPLQTEQLRSWVQQSDTYKALRQGCLAGDGKELSPQSVLDHMRAGISEDVIQDCTNDCKQSVRRWRQENLQNTHAFSDLRSSLQQAQLEQQGKKPVPGEPGAAKEAPLPKMPKGPLP